MSTLLNVIRTHDASSFYWPLSLTCLINGALWTVYGIFIGDGFIWGPNLLGAFLGLVQLGFIFAYRKSGTQKIDDDNVE
jgi:solute carrier family 50 protein (sugar transporter)